MTLAHDTAAHRFLITTPAGEAVLEYELSPENDTVVFTHTFVPETLRGQGMAEKLVRAGLAWAGEQHLHPEATCVYVQRYLQRHRA